MPAMEFDVSLFQQQLVGTADFWAMSTFSLSTPNRSAGSQLLSPYSTGDSGEAQITASDEATIQSQALWLLTPACVCLPELSATLLGKQTEVTFSWNFLTCDPYSGVGKGGLREQPLKTVACLVGDAGKGRGSPVQALG